MITAILPVGILTSANLLSVILPNAVAPSVQMPHLIQNLERFCHLNGDVIFGFNCSKKISNYFSSSKTSRQNKLVRLFLARINNLV
jgi:hypothetical protein